MPYEPTSGISNHLRVSTPTSLLRFVRPRSGCAHSLRRLFHARFTGAAPTSLQPVYFLTACPWPATTLLLTATLFKSHSVPRARGFLQVAVSKAHPIHQNSAAFSCSGASDTALRLIARLPLRVSIPRWPIIREQFVAPTNRLRYNLPMEGTAHIQYAKRSCHLDVARQQRNQSRLIQRANHWQVRLEKHRGRPSNPSRSFRSLGANPLPPREALPHAHFLEVFQV
jgi:hypothetical protein